MKANRSANAGPAGEARGHETDQDARRRLNRILGADGLPFSSDERCIAS